MSSEDKRGLIDVVEAATDIGEELPVAKNIFKVAKVVHRRWESHQNRRICKMLSNVGDELRYGDVDEEWEKFLARIDEPRIHATVVNAARAAIDSFDEAAIPYLARVVAWHASGNGPVTRDTRWLLKLLSECDFELLETLKHVIEHAHRFWDPDYELGTITVEKEGGVLQAGLWNSGELSDMTFWSVQEHAYIPVFDILKKNYFAWEAPAGQIGARSAPSIAVFSMKKVSVLHKILFAADVGG